jgi:hypothetical protein
MYPGSWNKHETQISACPFRTLLGVCLTSLLLVHTMLHRLSQAATAAVAKKIFVPAEAASLAVEVAKPKPPADQLLPPSAAAAVEQVCSSSFGYLQGCPDDTSVSCTCRLLPAAELLCYNTGAMMHSSYSCQDTAAAVKPPKQPPTVPSVLEGHRGPLAFSFGPYSMAARMAVTACR